MELCRVSGSQPEEDRRERIASARGATPAELAPGKSSGRGWKPRVREGNDQSCYSVTEVKELAPCPKGNEETSAEFKQESDK